MADDPLRQWLDVGVDEARRHRVWRAVESHRGRDTNAWRGIAVAAVALAFVGFMWGVRRPAPLALEDGSAPAETTADERSALVFEDASRVELDPGATWTPTRNDGLSFEARLAGGASFEVTPGGPRRWVVRRGRVRVEVVGTSFRIESLEGGGVRVAVRHGRVRVEADGAGERLLGEGDEWTIPGDPTSVSSTAAEPSRAEAPLGTAPGPVPTSELAESDVSTAGGADEHDDAAVSPTRLRQRWRELAREGDFAASYDALGPNLVRESQATTRAHELLLLADVARLSGHPAQAVVPLRRVIEEFSDDPSAGLAAVVLGRLYHDVLDEPHLAAETLAHAERLGVPGPLQLDVASRRALLGLMLGTEDSRPVALGYLLEHPDGPRASALRALLEPERP